jgi:hypothetical protein
MKVKIRKIQKKILEARENSVQGVRNSKIFEYSFGALKLVNLKFLCEVISITNSWPTKKKIQNDFFKNLRVNSESLRAISRWRPVWFWRKQFVRKVIVS